MPDAHLKVFRGAPGRPSGLVEFDVPVEEGMVVLDALHWIQGHEAPDLAVRWNCKAAKCGSCSAEVNGRPSLTCKTRLSDFDLATPITVEPMRAFPLIRDLVTDVSWNYEVNRTIEPFAPPSDVPQSVALAAGGHRARPGVPQVHRVLPVPGRLPRAAEPRDREAVHGPALPRPGRRPRDAPDRQADRRGYLKDEGGIGYCNITKCCTEVCPEHIKITDNAIIPLKERVADEYYDPIQWAWRKARAQPAPVRVAGRCPPGLPVRRRRPPSPAAHDARGRDPERPTPRRDAAGRQARKPPGLRGEPGRLSPRYDSAAQIGPARAARVAPDGAARGNPGSAGAVLIDAARPDARDPLAPADASISEYLGVQTNNVAEYTGVVRALALAAELGAREVHLLLDSKLIVEQLAGRWRVKDAKLIPLHIEARRILRSFDRWTAAHVPRAQNSAADALANEAIDRVAAGGPESCGRAVRLRRAGAGRAAASG